ncbi:MAG: hypothetical protein ACTHOJ_17180 [Sphingomonas oligoaromativorans]
MATLEITEYPAFGLYQGQPVPVGAEFVTQQVAIGADSAASDAVGADTRLVVLLADADCRIAIGRAPVASAVAPVTRKILSGQTVTLSVARGDKVAVIAA